MARALAGASHPLDNHRKHIPSLLTFALPPPPPRTGICWKHPEVRLPERGSKERINLPGRYDCKAYFTSVVVAERSGLARLLPLAGLSPQSDLPAPPPQASPPLLPRWPISRPYSSLENRWQRSGQQLL